MAHVSLCIKMISVSASQLHKNGLRFDCIPSINIICISVTEMTCGVDFIQLLKVACKEGKFLVEVLDDRR